jgi:hypothetical protein
MNNKLLGIQRVAWTGMYLRATQRGSNVLRRPDPDTDAGPLCQFGYNFTRRCAIVREP